jgi:hypothetical protein
VPAHHQAIALSAAEVIEGVGETVDEEESAAAFGEGVGEVEGFGEFEAWGVVGDADFDVGWGDFDGDDDVEVAAGAGGVADGVVAGFDGGEFPAVEVIVGEAVLLEEGAE